MAFTNVFVWLVGIAVAYAVLWHAIDRLVCR